MPIGILLVGGNPPERHNVRALLEREGLEVLGEASDGRELVDLAVWLRPAVVVLDCSISRMIALRAAHQIVGLCRETQVVLLSERADEDEIIAAFRAGIQGYVVQADVPATLVRAIREVTRGHFFLSPGASRALAQVYLPQTASPPPALP